MKKVVLILLTIPALVFAQKPIKPNLNKAIGAWREGNLQEAKEIIDLSIADPKLSNDGKAWYYKGVIYSSLDTTSNEAFKALSPNALEVAVESFKKADALSKEGTEFFVPDPKDIMAAANNTKSIQLERLSNYYLDKAVKFLQADEPNYEAAIKAIDQSAYVFENAMDKYVNDTLAYYVKAIAAQSAEKFDVAIEAVDKYNLKGGRSPEVYMILFQIYNDAKDDKNKALEVVREGKAKFPKDDTFGLLEIELLIKLDKIADARTGLEEAVKKDPQNKTIHFYLGFVNFSLNNYPDAKKNFEDALKIDPNYTVAQISLAKIITDDAKKIRREMNALGISEADKKKKLALDKVYVEKLRTALPYWEKAEKLAPSDTEVLDELYLIYLDLGDEAQIKRIQQRQKQLGVEG